MFRTLKLKLTFINMAVVGITFLFLISGIYILMERATYRQNILILSGIADVMPYNSKPRVKLPFARQRLGYIYAAVDAENNIVQAFSDPKVHSDDLKLMVEKALDEPRYSNTFSFNNEIFRFVKREIENRGTVFAFVNITHEVEMRSRLLTVLILIGSTGLLLTFLVSLYMANRALLPIKDSWQKQKNFVADASHELRTPLSVIQTNLEVVLQEPESKVQDQIKWLKNIQAEYRRMSKLVDDLLFLARADSNQKMLEFTSFSFNLLIDEVVCKFIPMAKEKDITLEYPMKNPVDFCGNEAYIEQLTVILLDNAVKYTPHGGKITTRVQEAENEIILSVSNTGNVIPLYHQKKIFERFYRLDNARSRETGGSGLGLSIADWITKEHGGRIRVQSSDSSDSTTFEVTLPKKKGK